MNLLDKIDATVGAILARALEGEEISWQDGLRLCQTSGPEFQATIAAADELRRRQVGEIVTYVINRNINFTNVCVKHCGFCAFSRTYRSEQGYLLPLNEIVRRVGEAAEMGATEVCIQAGLPPDMDGNFYVELTAAVKKNFPDVHIHAFSPEEVLYGATRSGTSIHDYLVALKAAGLGSLPGTSAEILDQEIRDVISPGRITVKQWVEIITTAHSLGIPTTSTIMYGHLETPIHWVKHMNLLRDIQQETHGFTEFVPLSMIYQEAPMYHHRLAPTLRPGPSGNEVVKMHAVARLMLGASLRNIQSSWVKEGPKLAQYLLSTGANDVGGTLINESISTSAGAQFGQLVPPRELRRLIRDAGRTPAQRKTNYDLLKVYSVDDNEVSALDDVWDGDAQFGSYHKLAASNEFRFHR
ncbi:MAG TPA: 5-amino-6-(D-ribitylamino)uracil--L-tyrosine 4-hydroxyphenyl transferase CofH [Terriglobia bacterium]|nr:5-amino-6-(D-ribitylamino)uracil--L-tyrosine 4-hydroxyphenyl transferase CofH [Terriglobia bacterium]